MSTPKPGPRLGQDNNPGNARWCDEHRRLECTGNRAHGMGPCHAPAVRGINNCKRHAGKTIKRAEAEGKARITAWNAQGDGERIDPGIAVMALLQQAWVRVSVYNHLLREQVEQEGGSNGELEPGIRPDNSGLIGYRFGAAGKEGTIYATNEEVRALVRLEAEERDRVVKYAETAHKMGVSDRITSLAERWSDTVIAKVVLMMQGLDLTPEQESRVPGLLQTHLGSIELTAGSGSIE